MMEKGKRASLVLVLLCQLVSAQNMANKSSAGQSWFKHIEFLASDALEGRETGSEGHRRAAKYIASAFKRAGLRPAGGSKGYLQQVKFNSRKIIEGRSSLSIVRNGKEEPLVLGDDASIGMGVESAPRTEASLVFVGYGLTVPEMRYDDLAGLDLRGKVAVLLSGGPSDIPGPLRAHYQNTRWEFLKRAGVIGVISIQNPIGQDIPWERSKLSRLRPSLSLADPTLEENAGQQLSVTFNAAKAEKLFVDSGHTFSEMMKLAE